MEKINLGDQVKDNITGLKGIAVGKLDWIWNETSIGVQTKVNEKGEISDIEWIDETRLTVMKKNVVVGQDPIPSIVELGDEVQDRVTGYKGIATGRTLWLYGCNRVAVQQKVKKGETKIEKAQLFDEEALVLIKKKVVKKPKDKQWGPAHIIPTQKGI